MKESTRTRIRRFIAFLLLLALIAACFFFSSCEGADEPQESPVPGMRPEGAVPVGFAIAATDRTDTRAGEIITNDNIESMGVFASATGAAEWTPSAAGPSFMYNQRVTRDPATGEWTYAPLKYWSADPGDHISFFAYAPHMEAGANIRFSDNTWHGYPFFTYTQPADAAQQVDLLVAPPELNRTKTTEAVNFRLSHVLTKVVIAMKSLEPITVTNVEITNVPSVGDGLFDNSAAGFRWNAIRQPFVTCRSTTPVAVAARTEEGVPVATFFLMPRPASLYAMKVNVTYVKAGVTITRTGISLPAQPDAWKAGQSVTYTVRATGSLDKATWGDVLCWDRENPADCYAVYCGSLNAEDKKKARAVVYFVSSGMENVSDYGGKLSKIHGYAVALREPWEVGASGVKECPWATDYGNIHKKYAGTEANPGLWSGYSDTQALKQTAANLGRPLYTYFPAAYYASEAYERSVSSPPGTSGWYLPSAAQGTTLNSYWSGNRILPPIFKEVLGDEFYDWNGLSYWSTTEFAKTESPEIAYSINIDGQVVISQRNKQAQFRVRPLITY